MSDFLRSPCIVAHQAPLSMHFARQEYWTRLPCPSPGNLLDPGIEPESLTSPVLQADSLPLVPPGKLCPSLSPRVCSNYCPLSQWCYLTISLSVASFPSCPQSFLASGSFPMSPCFTSDGQSIGASASASVFPMNIQGWFPLGLTGLISLWFKGFFSTTI